MSTRKTITLLGGTGHVGRVFINTFIEYNLHVRILARSPEKMREAYPDCEIIPGSMLNPEDTAKSLTGADAAFLITPIGGNNDMTIELKAARAAITAAKTTDLPHLMFSSVLQKEHATGIPLIDSKRLIEAYLADSGVPWSSLRAGFYMEDVLGLAPWTLKAGVFFFPLSSRHVYSFTTQRDQARLAAQLLESGSVLLTSVDVIEPEPRSMQDTVELLEKTLGRKIRASSDRPWLTLLRLLLPLMHGLNPVMVSKTGMLEYFNQSEYTGDPSMLEHLVPGFSTTGMEKFIRTQLA